jgi:acyl-CoA thioesterase FadM
MSGVSLRRAESHWVAIGNPRQQKESYGFAMHMIFRTALVWLRSRRGPAVGVHDVAHLRLRVTPTDLDTLGHVNNGIYLSLMDLGRMDLLIRAGAWKRLSALGYYPVVASETISFRKSLQPRQRFTLQTRVIGYDEKSVYVEQRFVAHEEIYAVGFIRGRFLKKTGGTVSIAELATALDVDTSTLPVPEWLARWAKDVALPASRDTAPSDWS